MLICVWRVSFPEQVGVEFGGDERVRGSIGCIGVMPVGKARSMCICVWCG